MQHKRNQFFNFFISCVPGAGQMYQGFLKRGTSLMTIFFIEIFLAGIVNIDWLLNICHSNSYINMVIFVF